MTTPNITLTANLHAKLTTNLQASSVYRILTYLTVNQADEPPFVNKVFTVKKVYTVKIVKTVLTVKTAVIAPIPKRRCVQKFRKALCPKF